MGAKKQKKQMNDRINFITTAINDAQATIRAIDTKLGAMTALSILPFSSIEKLWAHIGNVSTSVSPYLGCVLGFLFFTVWFASLFLLIRTISAIDNPVKHISSAALAKGVFYSGGLFKFGLKDYFYSNINVQSEKSVEEQFQEYPDTPEKVVEELSFEHLKLIYIRDIKSYRLKGAMVSIFVWFSLGIVILGCSKFL